MKKRKKKDVEIIAYDKNTGEIVEGVPVLCGVKRNPYDRGWIMNSQEGLEIIAKDKEITGRIHRILWFLIARLDFENWIQITQKEICEELGMRKEDVSSGIKLLEKKDILLRGPKIGRSYSFRINPYFGWKGDVRNLEKYREEKYKSKENKNKINIKDIKSDKNSKISKFSEEIKDFSRKYDIPMEKVKALMEEGVLKLDKEN